jgi:organic radical activating enzyme
MKVSLNVNTACNYNCWYCFSHSKTNTELDKNYIIQFLNNLPKNAEIQVLGGEPTLYSHFEYLIKCLENSGLSYYIQTNLSDEAFEVIKRYDFGVCASLHPGVNFANFAAKCLQIKDRIKSIDVMFYNEKAFESAKKLKALLKNTEIKLRILTALGCEDSAILRKKFLILIYYYINLKIKFYDSHSDLFEGDDYIARKLQQFKPDYYPKECPMPFINLSAGGEESNCPYGASHNGTLCKFCPLY